MVQNCLYDTSNIAKSETINHQLVHKDFQSLNHVFESSLARGLKGFCQKKKLHWVLGDVTAIEFGLGSKKDISSAEG